MTRSEADLPTTPVTDMNHTDALIQVLNSTSSCILVPCLVVPRCRRIRVDD